MSVRSVAVQLSATVAPFKAQMAAAGHIVGQFGAEVQAAAVKNNKAAMAMAAGMAAVGVAAVAMAAVSVKSAIELETRLQNVATIWTDTGTTVAAAGNQIVEMSRSLPQSANNLAEGLYQVASSGFQGAAGMQVLEASATAASAGLTTTEVAATGITAVLNAYGLTAGKAAHVSDVLFQTVNLGVVSFEQLSNVLGDFVGLAAIAGISIEEVSAAYATMTLSGISAAESGTATARVIQSILQPSEDLAAVLSAAGYASGQAALDALNLKGVIELLSKATGGSATMMGILVPEMRALKGTLALTSAEGANYNRVQGDMNDQAKLVGATQRALAEQAKSTSFQFGIFKNTIAAVGIEFGQALLPVIKPVIGLFQAMASTFLAIPGPLQTIVLGVGLLAAGAIGLAGAFLLLSPAIAAATALIGASTVAMGVFQGAMIGLQAAMPVIGAIGLALAIATPFVLSWAKAHGDAKKQAEDLKATLDAETGAVAADTNAWIVNKIVKEDLAAKAAVFGISVELLAAAMKGEAPAVAEFNAKLAGGADAMNATSQAFDDGKIHVVNTTSAHKELGKAVNTVSGDLAKAQAAWRTDKTLKDAVTGSTEAATQATLDNANAIKALGTALTGIASISNVLSAASAAQTSGQSTITDTVKAAVDERQQVEKDAQDQTQKAEKDALDARNQTVKDALDERQKIEKDALALTHRTVMDALDLRFRAEMDAYDREAREQNNALSDRQRVEKNAMDDRLALLDVEYDKRKKAENRAYEAEVDRIQGLIDSTFGEEREAHKAELITLEDSHDDRLGVIDQAKKAEARTLTDGLDDTQRAEKQGLNDTLGLVKDNITDRQDAEKTAATDAYTAQVNALGTRHTTEKTALDVTLKALTDNLDLQQLAVTRQLEKRQTAEDAAADTRRTSGQAKADLTLADVQAQLTKLNTESETSLAALTTIYTRGGGNVSLAMLAELQKLPPKVQTELANAGQPAFDKFIEAFRVGMATKDLGPIAREADRIGGAIGKGLGVGLLAGLNAFLAAPAGAGGGFGLLGLPLGIKEIEGRAAGGPIEAGRPYVVGEDGPELRIFDRPGTIIPTGGWGMTPSAGIAGGGGSPGGRGGDVSITLGGLSIEAHVAPHADPDSVGQAIAVHAQRVVEAALEDVTRKVLVKAWRN